MQFNFLWNFNSAMQISAFFHPFHSTLNGQISKKVENILIWYNSWEDKKYPKILVMANFLFNFVLSLRITNAF
jgi:hypothetical protein